MTKTIRKTYPKDFSIGVLVIIFALVFFLSGQLFEKQPTEEDTLVTKYLGEFLASCAVIIMVLILWEEILFPVKIRPHGDGLVFRNHGTKLLVQAIIYLFIPAIVIFLYMTFDVSTFRFFGWAAVITLLPIIGKLVSGINNYNDFLILTSTTIEYKNNELEGVFHLKDVQKLRLIKDESQDHQKIEVVQSSGETVVIDLDEMELEEYYDSIDEYIETNYKGLLEA